MLGITVSDSIALATLVGGTIATVYGLRWGKQARELGPPEISSASRPVAFLGGAVTDHAVMERLTVAIESVAKVLAAGITSNERISENEMADRLAAIKTSTEETSERMEELLRKIEDREIGGRRPPRTGNKGDHQ